jgi:type II restriction enzyme
MPLSVYEKKEIKKIIKDAIIKKIKEYKLKGDVKPFHERLFSKERIRATSFFHSCSTTIGVTLFQNIAYLIARGNKNFKEVKKQHEVIGYFSNNAKSLIEDIIFDLGRKQNDPKKRKPNIEKEIKEVLKVSGKGKKSSQIADLFIIDLDNNEIYIEIKTIKPNKGESEKIKRSLLKIVALRNKPIKVLCGLAYNPYEPEEFAWPLPLNYLKIGEDLLVGKEFWDFLGGKGTYEELLNIFEEVGKELKDELENKFKKIIEEN